MRKIVGLVLWVLILLSYQEPSNGAGRTAKQAPDTAAWLADFAQLKHEMAAHYANLEWAVTERGLDLRALSDQTIASLKNATNDAAAHRRD